MPGSKGYYDTKRQCALLGRQSQSRPLDNKNSNHYSRSRAPNQQRAFGGQPLGHHGGLTTEIHCLPSDPELSKCYNNVIVESAARLAGQPLGHHGGRLAPGRAGEARAAEGGAHLGAEQLQQGHQAGGGAHKLPRRQAQHLQRTFSSIGFFFILSILGLFFSLFFFCLPDLCRLLHHNAEFRHAALASFILAIHPYGILCWNAVMRKAQHLVVVLRRLGDGELFPAAGCRWVFSMCTSPISKTLADATCGARSVYQSCSSSTGFEQVGCSTHA